MTKQLCLWSLMLGLAVSAQAAQEVRPLEPGQPVEREIAGGESHTYQLMLTAGQFVRLHLDQRAIDAVLTLSAPDGKKLVVMNLTIAGESESLSTEAATAGSYRVTVRAEGTATLRGSYRLEAAVQATATAQDRKRMTAEALLVEARELGNQAGRTAPQVIEKLQQALPVWRELDEPSWTAYSLFLIGIAYFDLSRFLKAIEYYGQALAIYREIGNRTREGNTLNYLGRAYANMGRREEAIEYYEQALTIAREVKNRRGEASALNNLGVVHNSLGRDEKAIEYYEQVVALEREVKDRQVEAVVLSNLGIMYTGLSRYERAIECYEQGLAAFREIIDRKGEAGVLLTLGQAYSLLGRPEKTIEYAEKALAIFREIKNRRGENAALNTLGRVYYALGRDEKAIEYYEKAVAIVRGVRDRTSDGDPLLSLGGIYALRNRPEKAIEYFERALANSRDVRNRRHERAALLNLGDTYHALGRLDEAISYHEQALLIAREFKAQAQEAEALNHLASDERSRGNLVRARSLIEESLAITESLRADLVSPESRAGFLASVQSSYQLYTDLLMRQHKAEPTKGLDALAVEVSERQRARSLLDLLTEARADVRQGVEAVLVERARSVGRQLNDKAQLLTEVNNPERAASLKQEISQLENDYERAQAAIRKSSPHYAALTQPQPLKLKEIQQQLDADTLLLEYALGEERSYLWTITKESLTSYELAKGEQIKQRALLVCELLTARSTSKRGETAMQRQERITQAEANLPAAAQELSQTLLGPVAAELGNKRLVIVADGVLQYVPFGMLPDPVGGKQKAVGSTSIDVHYQPLVVDHEVVSLPSASTLAIQRAELAGRQLAPKMLAVIADPVFDRTDVRFTMLVTGTSDKSQTQTVSFYDARSIEHLAENSGDKSGVATRLVIPRLPFTRQEGEQLLALTSRESSFRAMDFKASRATVLDPALGQYRYVHFATHGLLDSERPGLSALVLSMVDAQGKPQNGFLRANDIYNLKLPAELVVLSACQTGLGKEIKGEGLVGLTRGFMYAGAARVVVSLWSVNDKATAELMTKFYEKMLKQGERPAAALRAAQVEMWKQKQWQSPYYWAAFTLQGEWR